MEERGIKKSEVIMTVVNPDKLSKTHEKKIAKKIRKNGQLLIVYFVDDSNTAKIITVISTSKLNKYYA
jgi:hypothetical protein